MGRDATPNEEFTVVPPEGFRSCAWRRSRQFGDKALNVSFAKGGQRVRGTASGGWFQCGKTGLFLPTSYLRRCDVAEACQRSDETAGGDTGAERTELLLAVEEFTMVPPERFTSCTWRRSENLDDKASDVALVRKGEKVTGTISGAWFQCAKSGLFLPSYCCLRRSGEEGYAAVEKQSTEEDPKSEKLQAFTIVPPERFNSCAWRLTATPDDKAPDMAFARKGERVKGRILGGQWFQCAKSGLFLPSHFVRHVGEEREADCEDDAAQAESAAETEDAAMTVEGATERTGESEEKQGEEEEEEEVQELEVFTIVPPDGFVSCAWRRSTSLDDKAPGVAFARQGEQVRGILLGGQWFQCAKSGLYLPKKWLQHAGEEAEGDCEAEEDAAEPAEIEPAVDDKKPKTVAVNPPHVVKTTPSAPPMRVVARTPIRVVAPAPISGVSRVQSQARPSNAGGARREGGGGGTQWDVAKALGNQVVCMNYVRDACRSPDCRFGAHVRVMRTLTAPEPTELFAVAQPAKFRLLAQKWKEAGGQMPLVRAWEIRNRRNKELFRLTEHNLNIRNGKASAQIDGYHGTAEGNIISIAQNGFDTTRRCGQVYGEGEYFAKNPMVSVGYCKGGRFMFLCRLSLGQEGEWCDHTWVEDMQYYVVKQPRGAMQALPLYVLEFEYGEDYGYYRTEGTSELHERLDCLASKNNVSPELLKAFSGAQRPTVARRDAAMYNESTRWLWLGWLMPTLSEEEVERDVREFLRGIPVREVAAERNAMRLGASVLLDRPITRQTFLQLQQRSYRGFEISVDDASPNCPVRGKRNCPRLCGPSKYCRGWNLHGTAQWHHKCPFAHPAELCPTWGARRELRLEQVRRGTAEWDKIEGELLGCGRFGSHGAMDEGGKPVLTEIVQVVNHRLAKQYAARKAYLESTHEQVAEAELWYGTHSDSIEDLITHGLQPPADVLPSPQCPQSKRATKCSMCDNQCAHCKKPRHYDGSHKYGLGVYLADQPCKAHQKVRAPKVEKVGPQAQHLWEFQDYHGWSKFSGADAKTMEDAYQSKVGVLQNVSMSFSSYLGFRYRYDFRAMQQTNLQTGMVRQIRRRELSVTPARVRRVYTMIRCQTNLGSPLMIDGKLLSEDAMHGVVLPKDPAEFVDENSQEWDWAKGNNAYYIPGDESAQDSEYVVFHPWQIWPRYLVKYEVREDGE